MDVLLLGPLDVTVNGQSVRIERRQERQLLAILTLSPGRFVPVERLASLLWDDSPPERFRLGIQAMVSHLRSAIRSAGETNLRVLGRHGGYALEIDPNHVDLHRVRSLITDRGSATERDRAFTEALSLWRGTPLSDTFDELQRSRLLPDVDDLRIAAIEGQLEAHVDLGMHRSTIAPLRALIAEHRLREPPVRLLMIALHRSGRTSESLAEYDAFAARLADETGLDPSADLSMVRVAILRDDITLAPTDRAEPTPAAPAQLPAPPQPFVGRTAEIDALTRFTAAEPNAAAIVITGGAGTGKTALGLQWAHGIRHQFPDGQLFLDLHGYSRVTPLSTIEALGYLLISLGTAPAHVPSDVTRATAMYRTRVAGRRLLIILDNVATAEQIRPLLSGDSASRVLVTSRDRLTGLTAINGAHRLELGPLTPDEARTLLHRVVGGSRLDSASRSVQIQLAEACDHMPIALRIVAARLLDEPELTAETFLAELAERRLGALAIDGDNAAKIQAAFDLSYHRLPATARRMFRVLGLVPATAMTAAAAATLTASSAPAVERALEQLTDAHLIVRTDTNRHTMHDLLRYYAEALGEAEDSSGERSASIGRLFDWYLERAAHAAELLQPGSMRILLDRVAAAFDDRDAAMAWLNDELAVMIQLIVNGSRSGPYAQAALLADQLRGYLWIRRYPVDWQTVARAGLRAAEHAGHLPLRAASHLSLGQVHQLTGDHLGAAAHYRRALRFFGTSRRADGQRSASNALGALHASLGDTPRAIRYLEFSLALPAAAGQHGVAAALGNLGNLYAMSGKLNLAYDRHTAALHLYRESGAKPNEAVTLANLGAVCLYSGRFEEADQHLAASLAGARDVGMVNTESVALINLTLLRSLTGAAESAAADIERALELSRSTGDLMNEANAHNAAGQRHFAVNAFGAAARAHQQALDLARTTHAREIEIEALVGLARSNIAGDEEAVETARAALDAATQLDLLLLQADAQIALAGALHRSGQLTDAFQYARRALDLCTDLGYVVGATRARETLAELSETEVRAGSL